MLKISSTDFATIIRVVELFCGNFCFNTIGQAPDAAEHVVERGGRVAARLGAGARLAARLRRGRGAGAQGVAGRGAR